MEDESSGVRVDLQFSTRKQRVAVEVEMKDGHVVENVRKDLEAGFDWVVCLVDVEVSATRIQEKLASQLKELLGEPPKVDIGELRSFEAVLARILDSASAPLRPPNQNKERSGSALRRARRARPKVPFQLERPSSDDPGGLITPLAADYLGLSPATLETFRCRGGGPAFAKLGRRVVYRREDLDRWVTDRRRGSTSDSGTIV